MFLKTGLKQKPVDKWKGPESAEALRWKAGNTGVGLVDAAMRELNQTGYMSNRTRQVVASFLCKDLYVDWRIGAEYFEEKLLDHDPSSNWGNWSYQAGVGNDPREGRRFNPIKQSHDYDPSGEYIKTWCPEVKDVTEKMGWVLHWTINEKQQRLLGLDDLPQCKNPIKGLCSNDERTKNGKERVGYKKNSKSKRDFRRGEGGRLAYQ